MRYPVWKRLIQQTETAETSSFLLEVKDLRLLKFLEMVDNWKEFDSQTKSTILSDVLLHSI